MSVTFVFVSGLSYVDLYLDDQLRCIALRLYYEIETRAKFVMLAYGYIMSTAKNANSVNMRSNGLRDTLLERKKHAEVNRTSANYRQLTITWLTLIITIN